MSEYWIQKRSVNAPWRDRGGPFGSAEEAWPHLDAWERDHAASVRMAQDLRHKHAHVEYRLVCRSDAVVSRPGNKTANGGCTAVSCPAEPVWEGNLTLHTHNPEVSWAVPVKYCDEHEQSTRGWIKAGMVLSVSRILES